MYKRKIEDVLLRWKESAHKKALVIKGCRQCGKTSSVLDFAKKNYKYIIYLDFHQHQEYKSFFNGSLDIDTITFNITASIVDARFVAGQTCIIFDEIQDCPLARSSLKFFCLDGRYDVICTGSLLGVNGYKDKAMRQEEREASIPVGFEQIVTMYPMDFEEWLWANGIQKMHIDYLRDCLVNEKPVSDAIHQRMCELLIRYVVVGGMPEVVATCLETNNMNDVIQLQHSIVESYKSDMVKYAPMGDKAGIRQCFESIPAQLSKENKKFQYSLVKKGGRARDFLDSLQWIEDAGIIKRCYNTSAPELPLSGNAFPDIFKVYMSDIGLLVSMLEEGTVSSILQGDLYCYKGAVFENLAADIFGKMGRQLFYYHKEAGIELDFLIRYKGQCCPVECKATSGNSKSLKTVLNNPDHYHISNAIKLGDYNIGRANGVLTLPFYMAFLLTEV